MFTKSDASPRDQLIECKQVLDDYDKDHQRNDQ